MPARTKPAIHPAAIHMTGEQARCDNCSWTGHMIQTNPIRDAFLRLDAGAEVPAGECPDCGAPAYLARKEY